MLRKLAVPLFAFFSLSYLTGLAQAQITATPNSLTFNAPYNPIGIALTGSQTGVNISTTQAWLSVDITSSTTLPSVVVARVNTTGLTNGTYNAFISIFPTNPSVPAVSIPVTLNLGTGGGTTTGAVGVSPNVLNFTSVSGSTPASQVFNINAPANTTYSIIPTFAANSGWLNVTPTQGTTTTTSTPVTVSVSPGALPQGGTYSAYLQVSIPGQPTQVVLVNLTVGTPSISVNPNTITFNYQPGQAIPGNQTFTLTTPAATTFVAFPSQISGTSAGTWLTLPVNSGQTTPTAQIQVGLNSAVVQAMTTPGTYYSVVSVGTTIPNQPQQLVLVALNVGTTGGGTGNNGVTFSPAQINFNYQPGGSTPNQQFTISAPTALSINLAASTTTGVQWLAVGPTSTTLIGSGSTFSANIGVGLQGAVFNLANGTYNGSIAVTQAGTGTLLATIPVVLTVGTTGGGATTGIATPSQLSFSYQGNQPAPPTQTLTIVPTGGQQTSFTTQVSGQGGAAVNWLQVSPATGTAPGVVAVSIVNVGSLPPGTFQANITITFNNSTTPLVVPVTLNVTASTSPQIRTSINSANFNYQIGGQVPAVQSQSVDISSTGGVIGPVSFTAAAQTTTGGQWLSVTPPSGTTPIQSSIQINATNLAAGTYSGTVTYTAAGVNTVVPVTLTVSSLPLLSVPVPSLNFTYTLGSSFPQPVQVSVASTGTSVSVTPSFNVTSGASWLSVSPLQTSQTPASYQVSVSPSGLTEGTYYGTIIFTPTTPGSTGNGPVVIPVTLTVSGSAALVITPGPLSFTQFQGSAAPAAQTLNIASSGTLLSYTVNTSILSGTGWLAVNPTSGITPSQIQVSVNGQTLAPGTYSGSVIVTATGATNSPQVVPITLIVAAPPTVTATPTSLTFNANSSGGGTPPSQTITVASSGAVVNYTVQASVSSGATQWLSVTPASGATPGTITASVNLTNLQPGTYNGTITINTGLPTPITIPVTLNYVQVVPPTITAVTNAASFLPTAVSPGMIVSIFGTNLGPQTLVRARLTSANTIDTTLDTARIFFDGIPAPLVFVRNDVVSAIVPYGIGGRASTRIQAEYQGARSGTVDVRVVDTAPAIFTSNQQGNGQGAIQNNDFSANSASNPVTRGQFITIYLTGEGQTSPGGIDGVLASANLLRNPIAPVQVRIGGVQAQVLYVGSVPTVVLGLAQINVVIPPNAPTGGAVPVEVVVGGVSTQPNVTVAIR